MRTAYMMVLLVLSAAAHAKPAGGPTVGDPIALDLELRPGERVELVPMDAVELVEQDAGRVIVQGFRPGTHVLQFIATEEEGSTREITGAIEITSVLRPDDELEPAPLAPPVPLAPNRTAWIAIGVATLAAVVVWLQLLLMPRPSVAGGSILLSPAEELMQSIERVKRMSPSDERFATLSDASRRFLSRVDPRLGRELTTTELMERLTGHVPERLVGEIRDVLSEGDYAKFSPWGGRAVRFDSVLNEAADLAVLDHEGRSS